MNKNQDYLEFAKNIAYEAGKTMLAYFMSVDNGASYKGDKTIVTKADKAINSYLIQKVKEIYPDHSVDGEEESFGKSDHVWVCDPVDGTAMFARHIPVAVFSLALVVDGTPILGVVYDPFTDNLYSAIKGEGAYQNNKKISVNNYALDDMHAVSNFEMWPLAGYNVYPIVNELAFEEHTYFINLGSIIRSCVCVASGEFSVSIFPGTKGKNCDIAAIKVIVEEAGGKVTDFFGNEQRYDQDINGAIISNGVVHEEIVDAIKKHCKKL